MCVERKRHQMAQLICDKKTDLPFSECLKQEQGGNASCSGYGRCRVEEKSESQLDYMLSDKTENIFLKACPGSGKTEVVALKAAREMRSWNRFPGGIAVLTFTNNAADVISERVRQCVGVNKVSFPHFVDTFDSWLHGYIAHPFGYLRTKYKGQDGDHSIRQIVNDEKSDGWVNAYKLDTSYCFFKREQRDTDIPSTMPLFATSVHWNFESRCWSIKVPSGRKPIEDELYYNCDAFNLFREDKGWLTLERMRADFLNKKKDFLKAGFATYQDVEGICFQLLKKTSLAGLLSKRFPCIIVDECQDLSWIQMQILKRLMDAGSSVHFVGDLGQAIYGFKEVAPEKVAGFVDDNGFTEMPLLDNFRSVQPIVDLCQKLVDGDAVQGVTCEDTPRCLYFTYEQDHIVNVVERFEKVIEKYGVAYTKSVVLVRGKSTLSKLRPSSNSKIDKYQLYLAMALHLWEDGGSLALEDCLSLLGQFVSQMFFSKESAHGQNYYCPESVKSNLQWRLFLAKALKSCCSVDEGKLLDFSQTWTAWAGIVRKNIHLVLNECRGLLEDGQEEFLALSGAKFGALRGKANNPVQNSLVCATDPDSSLKIKTIHSVKGETHDAVMLVSAPTAAGSTGGHWKEWLKDPQSEYARFAYVASSRPQNLLVWAIPESSAAEKRQIEELGFKLYEEEESDVEGDVFSL